MGGDPPSEKPAFQAGWPATILQQRWTRGALVATLWNHSGRLSQGIVMSTTDTAPEALPQIVLQNPPQVQRLRRRNRLSSNVHQCFMITFRRSCDALDSLVPSCRPLSPCRPLQRSRFIHLLTVPPLQAPPIDDVSRFRGLAPACVTHIGIKIRTPWPLTRHIPRRGLDGGREGGGYVPRICL